MAEIGVFLNRSLCDTNPSEAEAVAYNEDGRKCHRRRSQHRDERDCEGDGDAALARAREGAAEPGKPENETRSRHDPYR